MRSLQFVALAAAMSAAFVARAPAQQMGNTLAIEAGPMLTLDDAVKLALGRNKDLKAASYYPGISRANLLVARGAFDPSLVFNRSYSETQFNTSIGPIPVNDQSKTDYYSAGIQGLLPVGTQYNVEMGSTRGGVSQAEGRGIIQSFETFGGFQVTQPLLKGFGFDANLLQVRIAKANRSISDQTYRQSAINTVTNVIIAYSNLQLAHDLLNSAERERALADTLLVEDEKKYKVGSVSQSDVIEARANRALYEEPILIAERQVQGTHRTSSGNTSGMTPFSRMSRSSHLRPCRSPR